MKRKSLTTRDAAPAGIAYRHAELDARAINVEARTVPAVISTEHSARRWFGFETLAHAPGAAVLERGAANGFPLLFAHNQGDPIGRARDVRLEGAELRAVLHFGEHERGEQVFEMVRNGTLTDVSIGYRVLEWDDEHAERRTATSWELFEVSVVSVPEDPHANMSRRDPDPEPAPAGQTREAEITAIFGDQVSRHASLYAMCISDPSCTPAMAQFHLRAAASSASASAALPNQSGGNYIAPGEAHEDKFRRAFDQWAALRYRLTPQLEYRERGETFTKVLDTEGAELAEEFRGEYRAAREARRDNPYIGMTPIELGRRWLIEVHGQTRAWQMDSSQVFDELVRRAATPHTPSDFTNLLANVSEKSLQVGYVEAPETWQIVARVGSLSTFHAAKRPVLSTFSDLDDITGDAEYQHGTFSEFNEPIQLSTYGKLFGLSRTALINDDLNAFGDVLRKMGRAANRKVGDSFWSVITTNGNMSDGNALFVAGHSNLAGSGAAPSVTTLNAALTAMATQTDPAGKTLGVRPEYIMHPWALWGTVKVLTGSAHVSANTEDNIWQGELVPVPEARLDADSATAWYLAASPMNVGTIEVAFLNGEQSPFLDSQAGWSRDGIEYKVRHDHGVAPSDWRGLYKNAGT